MQRNADTVAKTFQITAFALLFGCLVLFVFAYFKGAFASKEAFDLFLRSMGIFAVPVFLLLQIIQVVIPAMPALATGTGGVLAFGSIGGFVWNYVGVCLGSAVAFGIAHFCGKDVVIRLVGKKSYDKYIGRVVNDKKFLRFFAVMITLPLAPDDLLCYLAGLSNIKFRQFLLILILGKPLSAALYSIAIPFLMQLLSLL